MIHIHVRWHAGQMNKRGCADIPEFSQTWHRMMRNMITTPSSIITDALGIHSGTLVSTYMKLFLSFSFSVAFHTVGGIFAARQQLGEFRVFLLQFVAIAAEDGIIRLGKAWGLR